MTRKELALSVGQGLLLVSALIVGALTSSTDDWQPVGLFVVLLACAASSELFRFDINGFNVSTGFLAIMLAALLLGPAPAMVVCIASLLLNAVLRRSSWRNLLTNVATAASFPLVGSGFFELLDGPELIGGRREAALVLLVLATFMITNLVNFLTIAVDNAVMDHQPVRRSFQTVFLPTVPTEMAIGLLAAAVVFVYERHDVSALILLMTVAFIVQYLLGTALNSVHRKDELEARTQQLASLQVGLLSTVLQTLSMRDKMTARHSAAVARYARVVAREMGLSDRDQEIIHTAGLLHDIGKFIFPDSILMADTRLTNEQYEIVKKHPEQGARLVERIEGYGSIAEVVLAHHERIDGRGYPFGLAGEEIPLASRIISVADTYDVMTSRDSYRVPVSSEEAVAELRRVSGTQLDRHVVEIFVRLLERGGLSFRHADDADFEHELNFDTRVRDYAAPQPIAA